MTSTTPRNRHFVASVIEAGSAALPYGFAFSGLALGVGAILTETPLVGTCGAVAGVTAGLLSQFRAKQYRGQAVALRERLRSQRAQADTTNTELRARLSALEVAVWEVRTLAAATPVATPVAAPVQVVVEAPVAKEPVEVKVGEPAEQVVEKAAAEPVVTVEVETDVKAEAEAEVEAEPVQARPGLRLAQAAARITVPKTVLDAAVATTGSISLAEIARAAQKKDTQKKDTQKKQVQAAEKVDAVSAA